MDVFAHRVELPTRQGDQSPGRLGAPPRDNADERRRTTANMMSSRRPDQQLGPCGGCPWTPPDGDRTPCDVKLAGIPGRSAPRWPGPGPSSFGWRSGRQRPTATSARNTGSESAGRHPVPTPEACGRDPVSGRSNPFKRVSQVRILSGAQAKRPPADHSRRSLTSARLGAAGRDGGGPRSRRRRGRRHRV